MRYPIFVIKHRDYDLILGQVFLNLIKFSQEFKLNGIFSIIMHLQTQQLVIFQTLTSQNLANETENLIFSLTLNEIWGIFRVHGVFLFLY